MPAKVYFSKEITPEKVVELYRALGIGLPGKVAVKVHSGEKGNQNFLRPSSGSPWSRPCTAPSWSATPPTAMPPAACATTPSRTCKLLEEHGWNKYFDVDLMDAEGPDVVLAHPERQGPEGEPWWARTS